MNHSNKVLIASALILGGLLISASPALAATSGPNNPGTAENATGIGTVVWTNPSNAKVQDSAYATVLLPGQVISNYLKATNYGFNIPADATVLGIKVDISRKASFANRIKDTEVKIVKAGAIGGNNQAAVGSWPTVEAVASYGGDSDLWGQAWTAADINSPDFGAAISAENFSNFTATNRIASVNSVQITVTYSVPDTTAPVITRLGDDPVNLTVGDPAYVDAGATALDDVDGNITGSIVTTVTPGPVDTSAPGVFTVHYNVSDAAGNPAAEVTRTVNVNVAPPTPDTTAPVITRLGNDPVNLTVGDPAYVDAGATALDDVDGDITANIVTTVTPGPVDTSAPGVFTVHYNVSDAAGNPAAEVTRTVNVNAAVPPPDTTPDAFLFTDQTDVALSTVIESNTITVAGIDSPANISVIGGDYSVNGGDYTGVAGTVAVGDTVKVRHTSSATNSTSVHTTLTIGGVSDTFTSTTVAAPEPVTHTLTYTAGPNGSITGPTPQVVNDGADGAAVTAVANAGFHFVDWSDGSTANPRTDTNVTGDVSVTANFAADEAPPPEDTTPPTVTSYTLNGSEQSVVFNPNDPASVTIVINTDEPVKFTRIKILNSANEEVKFFTQIGSFSPTATKVWDGKAGGVVVPDGVYTLQVNIKDAANNTNNNLNLTPYTITVDTAVPPPPVPTHTLTYTAGPNGSITGPTPQVVNDGADGAAVTAVANAGFHFVDWSDGSTANPRTDTNVTGDVSVTANFAADEAPAPTPNFDETIGIDDNEWVLISAPRLLSEAPTITDDEGGAVALLVYRNGAFVVPSAGDDELVNPLSAFFIRTTNAGEVGFNFAVSNSPTQVSKQLNAGWNLVGTNDDGLAENEFATLQPEWTALYVPDTYNSRKATGHTSWGDDGDGQFNANPILNLVPDRNLSPYDGYWVSMNAPKVFSKNVSE